MTGAALRRVAVLCLVVLGLVLGGCYYVPAGLLDSEQHDLVEVGVLQWA